MVFSTTSRNVRVEHDRETDKIFLHAECKSDSGNWQSSSICLDDHLGISTEYKGFDTTQEQTASAQGQSLWSLLVPDRLNLKGVSVLCGKVREEHGGWETSIYLDLLFNNNNGQLVKESWSSSLLKSVAMINRGSVLTFFLLAPDGKLAISQLSLAEDLEYSSGCLRPRSNNSDIRFEFDDPRGYAYCISLMVKDGNYSSGWTRVDASFSDQFSNLKGKISTKDPDQSFHKEYPMSMYLELQKSLPSIGFIITGADTFSGEATRVTAQCIYLSAILSGALLGELLFGRVGASYAPAFAFMAGLTVKSAGGSFVGDPKLRDEIAVIALIRVFKAELPVATGLDLQEIWKAALESELSGGYDTDCRDKLKDCMRQEFTDQGVDLSILEEIMMSLDKIHDVGVNPAEMSEDDIKHLFGDYDHDGVDLLPPPPPTPESPPPASPPVSRPASPPPSSPPSSSPPDKKDDDGSDYISRWRQYIIAVQDQLYLLEPEVGGAIEESTAQALEAIANGLARLNQLLEFWPDYKGDDATNKQRLAIIQSATDLVGNGKQDVKDTDEDTSVLNKVLALEEKLNGLRTQFRDETTAEQAELDKIKPELQTAVEKMFADQKLYQSAQGKLLANIKEISDAELKHDPGATIKGGVEWYKDLLRRRTSAREETQSIADAADATYLQSEEIVVSIQARQAELNHIHKRRFSVEREITKAEMIIDDLKIMINGTKQQEDRVLSMVDLLSSTLDDLTHVGEPPYHRHDRKIADQMCTTVLKVHRESLVDPSFVDSAREAVTAVQNWFDDYMPKSVQEEIDAIVNNSLYQPSTNDDAKGDDEMELDEEQGPLVGYN